MIHLAQHAITSSARTLKNIINQGLTRSGAATSKMRLKVQLQVKEKINRKSNLCLQHIHFFLSDVILKIITFFILSIFIYIFFLVLMLEIVIYMATGSCAA